MARQYSSVASEKELASGIDDSTQSVSLNNVTGLPGTFPYTLIIDHDTASEEIVTVTAASGTTITVDRGEDGTVGLSHESGARVVHGATARDFQESRDHEEDTSNVHGTGSGNDVVGTGTTQTLESKTIDGGTNTLQNIPQSAVTDLVDDQDEQDSDIATNAGNISSLTSTVSGHESSSSVHGVAEVAGLSEAQTLTNKAIDGDDNSLSNISQESINRAILWKRPDNFIANHGVGDGQRQPGFNNINQINVATTGGTWATPGGAHSGQWTFPVEGIYLVTAAYDVRTVSANDNVILVLRLKRDMSSDDVDGITVVSANNTLGVPDTRETTVTLVKIVNVTSTTELWGLTLEVNGSGAVDVADNAGDDAGDTMCVYLGPNS